MAPFLKTLIDTSVYGKLIQEEKDILLKERIDERKDIIVFGNQVIKKELQETPDKIPSRLEEKQKLKRRLLELYDFLIKDHELEITGLVTYLANEYLTICTEIPKVNKEKLHNDFLIVACASFYGLDIVVSEDNRTMFSEEALKVYKKVNAKERLRVPKCISLVEFERILTL